jgi:8-oxo-dGTP pyrophosphatase MutT (NUDIX family)
VSAEERYLAAGGVVADGERVLVLRRPSRGEIRLPKGHVQPGETPQAAALREVAEESGYGELVVRADLGEQRVGFIRAGVRVVRDERFFLMTSTDFSHSRRAPAEEQFQPEWMTWAEAERALTFEGEREWLRRARRLQTPRFHD